MMEFHKMEFHKKVKGKNMKAFHKKEYHKGLGMSSFQDSGMSSFQELGRNNHLVCSNCLVLGMHSYQVLDRSSFRLVKDRNRYHLEMGRNTN